MVAVKQAPFTAPFARHAMAYVLAGGRGSRLMERYFHTRCRAGRGGCLLLGTRRGRGKRLVQNVQKTGEARIEAGMAELYCLASGQRSEAWRELIQTRYPCPVHKYGDYPYAARKCRLDLQPHEIARII